MAEKRSSALREILRPWLIRLLVGLPIVAGLYQFGCDQFDWPKLPVLWGMTGGGLPWWGWLLIAQAGFVYALFEYVRRIQLPGSYDDGPLREKIETAIGDTTRELQTLLETVRPALDSQTKMNDAFTTRIDAIETSHKAVVDDYQRMLAMEARLKETLEVPSLRLLELERKLGDARAQTVKLTNMLFLAFQALLARERVTRFTEHIMFEGDFLMSRVLAHQPVKDEHWVEWQSRKVTFDSAMNHWLEIAKGWQPNVEEWVNKVDPALLTDGRWVGLDSLFDGSNAVITYQTFAIRFERWKQFESSVRNAIHITAFGGPNSEAILRGLPNGGPNLETVAEALND